MFIGAGLSSLFAPDGIFLPTYHHCLAKVLCNPPLSSCYLEECASCPGISKFRDDLATLLDENLIDSITFKQWVSVDRSTLETYTKPMDINSLKFSVKSLRLYAHMLSLQLNRH